MLLISSSRRDGQALDRSFPISRDGGTKNLDSSLAGGLLGVLLLNVPLQHLQPKPVNHRSLYKAQNTKLLLQQHGSPFTRGFSGGVRERTPRGVSPLFPAGIDQLLIP